MKKENRFFLVMMFISYIAFIFCLYKNMSNDEYSNCILWILPIIYIIIEMFFFQDWNKIKSSYGVITIEVVAFIRYVLVIFSFYNEETPVYISECTVVTVMMAIELFFCKLIIHLKLKEKKDSINIINYNSRNVVFLVIALLYMVIILLNPNLINRISWINTEQTINADVTVLLAYGFSSIIISLLIYVLIYKSKFIISNKIKIIISLVFALFFSINTSVSTKGNITRWNLIVYIITISIILMHLYKKEKKFLRTLSIICIALLVMFSTFLKFSKKNVTDGVQDEFDSKQVVADNLDFKTLDSYFSGPYQVSKAVETKKLFNQNISVNTFIGDIFANCPKINKLFNESDVTPYYYNYAYYGHNRYSDKICPMIGQGYIYFGFIFAPILSIVVTYVCVTISNKIEGEKNIFIMYILTFSSIYMGLFMCVNMNIVFQSIWIKLLPIYFIYWLSKKININI